MEFGAATATLSKKLSNGYGVSGKSAYDGIFATPIKFRASSLSSRLDDYCEIFGGSEASLGSSIPILEIPQLDERKIFDDIRRSKLDYSKVFGGFGNLDTAVPYEELFAEPKKMDSFPKEALRRAKGENQSMKEDPANHLKENPVVSQELLDGARKISMSYHKINRGNEKGTNGTMHIAQLHAVPAYTCLIEEVNPRADKSIPVVLDADPGTRCRERTKESGHCTESGSGHSPDNANEQSSNSGVKDYNRSDSIHLFFDGYEISCGSDGTNHIKVPPSETVVGNLDNQNSNAVRSVATKCHASKRAVGADSPSYLDDLVDSNSEAAASVAALRKAIDEAQERINVAKESMKRKKEGIPDRLKRRFNNNLKTELKKEAKVSNKTIRLEETDMWRTFAEMDALPQILSEIGKPTMRAEQVIPDLKETFVAKEAVSETQQKSKTTQHKEEKVEVEWKEADHKATVIEFEQVDNDKKALNDYQWNEINKSRIAFEKLENFGQTIEVVEGARDQNEGNVNSGNESYGCKELVDETKFAQETLDHGVKDQRLKADEYAEETEKKVTSFHELADHEGKLGEQEVTIGEEKKFVCKQEEAEIRVEVSWEVEEYQRNLRAHQEPVEVEKEVTQEHKESEEKVEVSCELEECGLRELLEPIDNEKVLNPQGSELKSKERQIENWGCLEDGKKRKDVGFLDMDQESERSCGREGRENGFENIQVQKIMEEILDHIHDEEEIQEKITENGESDGKGRLEDAKENEKEQEVPIYLMEENERGRKNNSEWVEVIRVTQNGPNYEEKQTKEADKTTETSPNHEQDETEDLSKVQVADTSVQNNETLEVTPEEYAHDEQDDIMVASNTSFQAEEKYKEPEAVEETNDCGEKNTLETSSLTQGALELNKAMSQMQNIKEAVMFDSAATDVDETDIKVVHNQDQCSKEAENDRNLAMLVEELTPESVEISKEEKEAEVALNEEIDENQFDSCYEEKLVDNEQNVEASQLPYMSDWESNTFKNQESKTSDSNLKENHQATLGVEEKKANGTSQKVELEKKQLKKIDETKKREREREKEKLAVERAIREARERAFAEARERAVLERAAAEARRKNMSDGRERLGKTTGQPNEKTLAEKAAMEAKLKAERAAVERATAEARARALERALSEKAASEARFKSENFVAEKSFGASRDNGTRQRFYSKSFNNGDVFDGANGDSAQRCKARSERHQRIGERVAKALAEKNMRDRLVQKEQEERNRVAEALDADVKRWSSGKEGNLRALLSTLQYILGPDSGWQPIPLTDIVTNTAVKKAYRKATLFVHPDKLQQRGASIQQKYTCEKVFDLLKEAWNRFNMEER